MNSTIQELVELYIDLTESNLVQVNMSQNEIIILIVSDWFKGQSNEERLDYLAEGIDVVCPELKKDYKIHFLAYTQFEADARTFKLAV